MRVAVGNHDYPVTWFNTKEWLWGLGRNTAFETPYGDHGFRVIVVIVGTGMPQRRETFPGTPREGVAFVWALQWEKMGWQIIRLSCSFYKQGGSLKKWDDLPGRSHDQRVVESNALAYLLST